MSKHLLLLGLMIALFTPNSAWCNYFANGDDEPSVVRFDLEECLSSSGEPGSANDYSEFIADVFNTSECAELTVEGGHLYRLMPEVNMHSCSPGVDESTAMCVGISDDCSYQAGDDKAIRFDITVNPLGSEPTLVSEIRFFENAPETFNWINGPSGPNNYPTKYGIRVLVDGEVLYEVSDIDTENEWNEEVHDFTGISGFTITEATTFNVELLPYCPIGIVADVAAWDVDAITFTAGCLPVDGGDIEIEGGGVEVNVCLGDSADDLINVILSNSEGENSQWIITDADLNILDLPEAPPFNFEGASQGTSLIWHLSFLDPLTGAEVGLNAGDLEGCFDLSNPLTVIRTAVNSGEISLDGETSISICAGDGVPDPLDVTLTGQEGDNFTWVITDADGNILDLPDAPPFDLEGAGDGTCLIWHLAFGDGLSGVEIGMNAAELEGCFDFSNPITVEREGVHGGSISVDGATEFEICAGDGIDDIFDVELEDAFGANMAWVITDSDGIILDLPTEPPFNLEGVGEGTCLIWHLSFADGLVGVEIGMNASELEGCYDLSNAITVLRNGVDGGEIAFADGSDSVMVCSGDGILDTFSISLANSIGENMAWVITDADGVILSLPTMMPIDFEGAEEGVCLIWNLAFADGLVGAEVGLNANDLQGCFSLSNSIAVIREEAIGGELLFDDGTESIEICAGDGIPDPLNVSLTGNSGQNSAWVITDTEGLILDLPTSPPFDLENAPSGTCLIWHLSFSDGLEGAEVGMNASDLEGCFALSNSISVTRIGVDGGALSTDEGETQLIICADDGESDAFDVELTNAEGSNSAWVVTDNNGIILDLPSAPPFDLEGSGSGACLIWHLSFEDGLTGAEVGLNAGDLEGCFDLSNPITVTRLTGALCDLILCEAEGGEISFTSGAQDTVICVDDGIANPLDVSLSDNVGANSAWVITDTDANILALPAAPPFDLEGVEPGICLIWHLSFEDGLEGAIVGNNAATDLEGCYDLSNSLVVTRLTGEDCENLDCDVDGGSIVLTENGETEIEICVGDSIADPLSVDLSGEFGSFSQWVITNANGVILALPASPPFDLEDAPPGICLIWHLSYEEGLEGAVVDSNANNLEGCFDLSNPIIVIRLSGAACDNLNCDAEGGTLLTSDGLDAIEICADDNISDAFDVDLTGAVGDSSAWIITNVSGIIVALPDSPPFDLEGSPEGICLVWHLSYFDEIIGLEVGENALQLEGCLALSSPITVTKYSGNNCLMIGCEANAGLISFQDTSISQFFVCGGDGFDDLAEVELDGEIGTFSQWVITDNNGNILDLPAAPPFNFENAPSGICLIWHLSYEEGIEGAEVGLNANDITGCFALSNSLTVIRKLVNGGEIIFDTDSTEVEICVGDNESDSLMVNLSGAVGDSSQWVITDTFGVIIDLPLSPPFDFETAPAGVCNIWHLSYNYEIENLEVGADANDLDGCFMLSNPLTVIRLEGEDCDDGIVEPDSSSKIEFTVGPNPTSSTILIQFQAVPYSESQAFIFDSKGQLIGDYHSEMGRSIEVNVQAFHNGLYFVRVHSGEQSEIKKFIKID